MDSTFEHNGRLPSSEAQRGVDLPLLLSTLEKLAQGESIQAIKGWRAATGLGLREAKESVDALRPFVRTIEDKRAASVAREVPAILQGATALKNELAETRKMLRNSRKEAASWRKRLEDCRRRARQVVHWLSADPSR